MEGREQEVQNERTRVGDAQKLGGYAKTPPSGDPDGRRQYISNYIACHLLAPWLHHVHSILVFTGSRWWNG